MCIRDSSKTVQEKSLLYASKMWPLEANSTDLSAVGRSPGRPTNGHISDCWASGRPARSTVAWIQRAELPAGRPPGRPGPFLESRSSLAVDRVGRPALQPNKACTFVHVGRPTLGSVDCPGQPAEAKTELLRDWKLGIFPLIKSHKISKNLQK